MPETTLTDGSPVTDDHRELKENGQQKGYVVLSEEERAKGFVRPIRRSYIHVGLKVIGEMRDLTDEEKEQHPEYAAFEEFPESENPKVGRWWTHADFDRRDCGGDTKMALSIAETYARMPKFYGGTFCTKCKEHFPVDEFIWKGTDERVGS